MLRPPMRFRSCTKGQCRTDGALRGRGGRRWSLRSGLRARLAPAAPHRRPCPFRPSGVSRRLAADALRLSALRTRVVGFAEGAASFAVVGRISAAHPPASPEEAVPQPEPQACAGANTRRSPVLALGCRARRAPREHPRIRFAPRALRRIRPSDRALRLPRCARPVPRAAGRYQASVRLRHPPCTLNTTARGPNGPSWTWNRRGRV